MTFGQLSGWRAVGESETHLVIEAGSGWPYLLLADCHRAHTADVDVPRCLHCLRLRATTL